MRILGLSTVVTVDRTEAAAAVPPEAGVVSAGIPMPAGKCAREHALRHFGLDAFPANGDRLLAETTR